MASINFGRVVIGGLVGGVVANVCDTVANMTFLKDDMAAMAAKFGMDSAAAQSMSAAIPWIGVDFVFGLLTVFTYAAMRPRFGAGPKTAMIAGFTLFLAVSVVLFGFTTMGMMSTGSYVRGTLEALVTTLLGSLAGAAMYKEA
jgi:anti-sigma factor RsiW